MSLRETVTQLAAELSAAHKRLEQLESATPAEKSAIVGYYILKPGCDALWDGELHLTYEAARESLDSHFNPTETVGFDVFECRAVSPVSSPATTTRGEQR